MFAPATDEHADDILIYLRGRSDPFVTRTEGPDEKLVSALDDVELYENGWEGAFFEFTDEDGETLSVRFDQLVCMIVPAQFLAVDEGDETTK